MTEENFSPQESLRLIQSMITKDKTGYFGKQYSLSSLGLDHFYCLHRAICTEAYFQL